MSKVPPEGRRSRPFLLSIPAGVPFLENLADALLDGGLLPGLKPLRGNPLTLADAHIFLPTRRAVRELAQIISQKLGGAAILPRITALGDFDEDDNAFEDDAVPGLPDAIAETERRLVLAQLIQAWAKAVAGAVRDDEADLISTSPAEAMSLAIALGQLIDSFETEGAQWEQLAKLVPPEHDEIWRLTTSFLNLAADAWPGYLQERGLVGFAARRNAMLRALAKRFAEQPPSSPVIVAGSTGSNPATAELMKAVAHLPNGAVILHGLDVRADAETWNAIGGEEESAQNWTHPQHAFHRLLRRLNVQLGEVGLLGREDHERDRRRALVSQALLPSELTDRWTSLAIDRAAALDGVALVEAANEREEALAVALALREALDVPGRTAALITPDRPLARRVAAELKRWGIETEDSAGLPLADSSAGILARLVAEAAAHDLAPHKLIPLLRHPDARFGQDIETLFRTVDALEIGVLRGAAPPPGADGLLRKLDLERATGDDDKRFWHAAKRGLREEDWNAARALAEVLKTALEPLCALGLGRTATLYDLLAAHRDALTAVHEGAHGDRDAETLSGFFDEAIADGAKRIPARLVDYPALFKTMLRGKTARAKTAPHARLKILGTLEARLLGFDRVVLGGLNETIWPQAAQNDPFLSRPMRAALGLPPPEWRVGQSAHDFEQALGTKDVVLTRALKAGSAPSVAARWLQRLGAVSGSEWDAVKTRGAFYRDLSREMDAVNEALPRLRGPEPRPDPALRPKSLSVTEIETLIRDPYAIYARHVLRLEPLDGAGSLPEASDRGNIVHAALAEFSAKHNAFDANAEDTLIAIGRVHFAPFWDFPDVRALWWPRFERIARWFVEWERKRRPAIGRTHSEVRGRLEWQTVADESFALRGRADRFDETSSGYAVIDYKTGAPPGDKEVRVGFAPQLPLEAAMLDQGAFDGVERGPAGDLIYVHLSGQAQSGQEKIIDLGGSSAQEIGADRLQKLKELIDIYARPETPYLSNTQPKFVLRRMAAPYDHLARHAEWSLAPDPEEETDDV